jgi:hypothetical protein
MNLIDRLSNNSQIQISRKFLQWGPNFSVHTDGQTDRRTDMAQIIVGFANSAIAAVIIQNICYSSSSSIGTTTLSWVSVCSTFVDHSQQDGFYRVPLPAARLTPNLEENQGFRAFQISPQEAPSV